MVNFGSEVGDEGFLLAGAMDCLGLPLWAGDFHRLVVFIELDGKSARFSFAGLGVIPQMEV